MVDALNTVKTLDAVKEKLRIYNELLTDLFEKASNSTEVSLTQNKDQILSMIQTSLQFIRDNDVMTIPTRITRGSRFKSEHWNTLIDSTILDLEVAFARTRSLIDVINSTTNLINSKTYAILVKLDEMIDKIASLNALNTSQAHFTDVIFNTFTKDNNRIDDNDFKTTYQDGGGVLVLRDTYMDKVISSEANYNLMIESLHGNCTLKLYNNTMTPNSFVNSFDLSVYSPERLFINDYELGATPDGEVSKISYNGACVAVIVQMPAIKFINNINLKFASAGMSEIIDLYYCKQEAVDIQNFFWTRIPFTTENNNVRGTTINFPATEARSIMLVIGQTTAARSSIPRSSQIGISEDPLASISELIDKAKNNVPLVAKDKLQLYLNPDVVDLIDDQTAYLMNTILSILDTIVPAETGEMKPSDYVEIFEYNFGIYDFSVNLYHFNSGSTYKSEWYGGKGNVSDVYLTVSDNIKSNTTIGYYVDLVDGSHKVLPIGRTGSIDVFTVQDTTVRTYLSELLMNAEDITVRVNNGAPIAIGIYLPLTIPGKPLIANGIYIDPLVQLNLGDTITVQYTCPEKNGLNDLYEPERIGVFDYIGYPSMKNRNLIHGKKEVMLADVDNDGTFAIYEYPLEIRYKTWDAGGASGVIQVCEVNKDAVYIHESPVSGMLPETASGFIVPTDRTRIASKNIYFGIKESVPISGEILNVSKDYVAGSLHVLVNGSLIDKQEYPDLEAADHKTFQIDTGVSGLIEAYYMPVSWEESIINECVSNLAVPNYNQMTLGTDGLGTITLDYYPYIDRFIVRESTDPTSHWALSFGQFVNKLNENIVYTPITVRMDGRIVANVTDYLTQKPPSPDYFKFLGNNPMYYVKGNKVIFNTILKKRITISYYNTSDAFRLVAKLFNLNRKVDDVTPELYGYALYTTKRE